MARSSNIEQVLDTIIECVSDPDTDLVWSHWDSHQSMIEELLMHRSRLELNDTSQLKNLDLLFAPTGSLQEVSITNGWGDEFVRLSSVYDENRS